MFKKFFWHEEIPLASFAPANNNKNDLSTSVNLVTEEFDFSDLKFNSEKKNILLIDDEQLIITTARLMFINHPHFNLISSLCPIRGIEIIKIFPEKIDLLLLDLMMPAIYGLDVVNIIRDNLSNNSLPIIIQSAIIDKEEIKKASVHAQGFIAKPYTKHDLFTEIGKILL